MKILPSFLSLFFLISSSESFHVLDNYQVDKVFSAKFAGVVRIGYFHARSGLNILGYGTVITPWVILTSALVTYKRPIKNLMIYTNCKRKTLRDLIFVCTQKPVFNVIYQHGIEHSTRIEEFYALLIVPQYRVTGRTKPLNLASEYHRINYNNCFFVRWEMPTTARYRYGLLKIPLSISSNGTDKYNIQDDYGKDPLSKMVCRHVLNKFSNILGAPLFCQTQNSLNHYVQVGIATVNFTAYHLLNETDTQFMVTDGSFVNITTKAEKILWQIFQLKRKDIIKKFNNKITRYNLHLSRGYYELINGYEKKIISLTKFLTNTNTKLNDGIAMIKSKLLISLP